MTSLFSGGKHEGEGTTVTLGVLCMLASVIFILYKLKVISLGYSVAKYLTDKNMLWFFAIATIILSINSLASTVGMFGASK